MRPGRRETNRQFLWAQFDRHIVWAEVEEMLERTSRLETSRGGVRHVSSIVLSTTVRPEALGYPPSIAGAPGPSPISVSELGDVWLGWLSWPGYWPLWQNGITPAPGEADHRLLAKHSDLIDSVAFHPDGRGLASAGRGGLVSIWDTNRRELSMAFSAGPCARCNLPELPRFHT